MSTIESREARTRSGRTVRVRSARPEDAAELVDYVFGILRDGEGMVRLPEEYLMTPETERTWIEEQIAHPDRLVLVAESGGVLVGMADFKPGERKRIAHTGTVGISVAVGWRGEGIGRALLEPLLEWARTNPRIEKVCLSVLGSNERAVALYRKLGFVEEGRALRQIRFADGRHDDDVLMACFV